MTVYTLSIVEGDVDHIPSGKDIFSPGSPITFEDLDPSTLVWLTEHGYEEPGRKVVVTPVDGSLNGLRVIASREVDL
ncbi:hypothetical protein FHR32_002958 [Streptosporangium album]|uniref:Uncharacterized protein n=1 Tax=Streptosporangium album TaxID=47479 RepID=A0A7W7W969_9ACTN|nr:hypothetical protein [Streptosporangium album]MBB4938653.1 hypothetical protein [Streptosporangium album]